MGILFGLVGLFFVGYTLWVVSFYKQPAELDKKFKKNQKIRPYLKKGSDVLWYAFWNFFVAVIFLIIAWRIKFPTTVIH